jgi:hypothetical protein
MRSAVVFRVFAGLALVVALPAAAAAFSYTLGPDLQVSGPSTLAACTAGASADFASAYTNTEVEPQVAVNPLNPRRDGRRLTAGPLARWRRARTQLVAVGERWRKLGKAA